MEREYKNLEFGREVNKALLVFSCSKIDGILTCSFAHVARLAGTISMGLSFILGSECKFNPN
jgi:hypothetical protein